MSVLDSKMSQGQGGAGGIKAFLGLCTVIVLTGTALRFAGLFNDYWLDEIWEWNISRQVSSPVAIFTEVKHDNNHWLYTFFLYALREQPWYVYRLPALATGVASLLLIGLIGRQYGRLECVLSLLFAGLSYILVHYSTEARGYAPAVFFSLACFYLLRQQIRSYRWWRSALFVTSVILGFLSHLTFIYVYLALLLWSLVILFKGGDSWTTRALKFVALHGVPLCVISLFYFTIIRGMAHGGGDVRPVWLTLREVIVWTTGCPDFSVAVAVTATAVLLALSWELVLSRKDYDREWVFYLAAILIAPPLVLMPQDFRTLYARHFLVCIPFLLILMARFVARCLRGSQWVRLLAGSVVVALCAGNAFHLSQFFRDGRGHYRDAINYIVEQSPSDVVTVGADSDLRCHMILEFYTRQSPPKKPISFVPQGRWTKAAPSWVFLCHFDWEPALPRRIVCPNGVPYGLRQVFPYYGPSGWAWYAYLADRNGAHLEERVNERSGTRARQKD